MPTLLSFFEWLAKQKGLRTPVGDFARATGRDASFPREVASLEAVLTYVRGTPNGSAESVAIARAAYRAYERGVKPPSRV